MFLLKDHSLKHRDGDRPSVPALPAPRDADAGAGAVASSWYAQWHGKNCVSHALWAVPREFDALCPT